MDLMNTLKAAGSNMGRCRFRLGKALVSAQVGVSLVLVAGAALFIRTLINLQSVPLGFRPENLLVFQLDPTLNGYRDQRLLDFHETVLKRLDQIPGVRSASMSRWGLLSGSRTSDGVNAPGGKDIPVNIHYVAPRFFETMGIPVTAGRDIAWTDRENAPLVMAINRALAAKLFPGLHPVGRTALYGGKQVQIVGVCGDTKFDSIRDAVRPTAYIPFRQNSQHSMTYVMRSDLEPRAIIPPARAAVEEVDRNVPMFEIRTQAQRIDETIRRERLFAALLSGFAAVAVLLACLGIYGTLAYLVARRTPEIGLRLALGAVPRSVISMVLRESMLPVMLGVALGVWGAASASQLVKSMLFGLKPNDPATVGAVAVLLVTSTLLAAWWPARRASRIEPSIALRHE
jgi:predicted permease